MASTDSNATDAPAHPWEDETHRYHMLHVRLRLVLEEVIAARPSSLFEVGCGVGILRAALLRELPGLRYFGCDVSQSAVDALADRNVVRADLNDDPLPFAGQRFDCIVGSGIFEYVAEVPRLLAELRQRTLPGGRLIVTYFNMRHLYGVQQRLRGLPPFRHPTWRNDYSLAEFRGLLRAAGFAVRDEIPSNLGLRDSPSIGEERWNERALRLLRRVPLVKLFAHQVVFVVEASASLPPPTAA